MQMKDQDSTKRDPCMDWMIWDHLKVEGNFAIVKSLALLEFWSIFLCGYLALRKSSNISFGNAGASFLENFYPDEHMNSCLF